MIADLEETRRRLRSGTLPGALLRPGLGAVLSEGDRSLTRAALGLRTERVAGGLARLGLGQGDRVAIYAPNSLEWILAYLAAERLGAVVVPFNPAYRAAEAEHILNDSDPALVVTDRERRALVESLGRRVVPIQDLPEEAKAPPAPELTPESPAVIIYTSGTTGRPKGALLDHGNLLAQTRGAIEAWRWTGADRLVHALPLFHLHGLAMGLNGTLLSGGSLTLIQFTPAAVVAELQAGGSMLFGVPSMYQRLCDHLEEHPADLSRVRLFVSGSAPLPPALFERCERLLGQGPVERYGITEGGIVVSNPYDGPRRPGRVGFPFSGVEVRLGESDEVQLKGGQVFAGYWRNPIATREAFTPDGWFRTGDVGEIETDGSFAIRGRLKELIISGGFNVYPREVELVLEEHPRVAEVAVVGLPSDRWGEEVTAFVVPAGEVTELELIAFARERLATFKCPHTVRFVEYLPRNAMGKLERSKLV